MRYTTYLSSILVVFMLASAGIASANSLDVNISNAPCLPPFSSCSLNPDINGPGSPAQGFASFPVISLADGPWTFSFTTANPTSWGYQNGYYVAMFGTGGTFQMTAPDRLTFTGEITGGNVIFGIELEGADLTFDGQWANSQYASGELGYSFYSRTSFASLQVTEVPEPASLALLGSAVAGVWAARRRFLI